MSFIGDHVLLRIYRQSADRAPHTPTYERIVKAARAEGLAGCTILRGIMGYGASGALHQRAGWSLTEHVPIVVEIAETADRIKRFIEGRLSPFMRPGGTLTLERASVMMYRGRSAAGQAGQAILRLGGPLKPLSTVPAIDPGGSDMTINEDGVLLRIFAGESDRAEGRPLHEAIVRKCRELGLAGATVLRGIEGFGANSIVHKAHLLEMSTDLPIVIEIADAQAKIERLLPYLEQAVVEGMITMEHVAIIIYRHNPADAPGGPGPGSRA